MENYKQTKFKIFKDYNYKMAIINTDDFVGEELYSKINTEKFCYGKNGDLKLIDIKKENEK